MSLVSLDVASRFFLTYYNKKHKITHMTRRNDEHRPFLRVYTWTS